MCPGKPHRYHRFSSLLLVGSLEQLVFVLSLGMDVSMVLAHGEYISFVVSVQTLYIFRVVFFMVSSIDVAFAYHFEEEK